MSRHALRIVPPTRSRLAQLLRSWTQEPRVLHIGAADAGLRTSLTDAGFTLTLATNVDDLDITLPAGTCFGSVLLSPEALSTRDSLRSQLKLLRQAAEHVTPDGLVLIEVPLTNSGTPPERTDARHGAHIQITDELDLIAEMAGLRRTHRSNLTEDSHESAVVTLYRRKQ